jgi:hypothetical protein
VSAGSLSATIDGTPVTFTKVDAYYEGLDATWMRIWIKGHVENPVCYYISIGLTLPWGSTSVTANCLSFPMGDVNGSLGFAYGASGSGMYYSSNNTPGTCSGSFPVVPPQGYGHFMGTFEAILELPGTPNRVMLTSGSVDVMVPTI